MEIGILLPIFGGKMSEKSVAWRLLHVTAVQNKCRFLALHDVTSRVVDV